MTEQNKRLLVFFLVAILSGISGFYLGYNKADEDTANMLKMRLQELKSYKEIHKQFGSEWAHHYLRYIPYRRVMYGSIGRLINSTGPD